MITKFNTVYAGHVDIPDRGQNATPANERRFSNEHLAGVFSKAEAIARLMDETGWDTLWMAEHHFQPEGYEALPNLLMAAVHLCHHTKNLKLGCGFNITPMCVARHDGWPASDTRMAGRCASLRWPD
jgi:hypothetical protein